MRRLHVVRAIAGVAVLMGTVCATAQFRGPATELPTLVEFTACLLPSDACPEPRDVVRLVVKGEERATAFSDLTVLQGTALAGSLLSDLRLRPIRVFGPDEMLAKLAAGARVRVRAVLRLRSRYLFVESVEPPTAR